MRHTADVGDVIEDLGRPRRHLGERQGELGLPDRVDGAARARRGDGETGQHRQLGGEGLGAGYADLRPGEGLDDGVGLPLDRAFRHVDDGQDLLAGGAGVAQRRQGVDGLARLGYEQAEAARRQGASR